MGKDTVYWCRVCGTGTNNVTHEYLSLLNADDAYYQLYRNQNTVERAVVSGALQTAKQTYNSLAASIVEAIEVLNRHNRFEIGSERPGFRSWTLTPSDVQSPDVDTTTRQWQLIFHSYFIFDRRDEEFIVTFPNLEIPGRQ